MPRAKQVNSKAVSISRTSGFVVLAALFLGWSFSALSADEAVTPEPAMQLAPIRFGVSNYGSIDYLMRYDDLGTSENWQQTTALNVGVRANAQSFIWQPWLVQVGGHVDASVGTSMTDNGNRVADMSRTGEALYRVVSGGAGLKLLPRSRYPFEANFTRTDSRYIVGLVKSESATLTDQIDLSHSYRTRYRGQGYTVRYQNTRMEDNNALVDKIQLLTFTLSLQPFRRQGLQFEFNKGRNDSMRTDSTVWNSSLISRHTYQPDSTLSVATLASRINTSYRLLTNETGMETLQFSSAGAWRPTNRFTLSGGVRLFETSSYNGATSTPASGYTGANLGANYAVTDWFRLYGSVSVSDTNGTQTVSSSALSNLSAAVQYRPKTIKIGSFDYNRYIAANISNNTSSVTDQTANSSSSETSQTFSLRLQHGLGNTTALGSGSLGSSVTQSLSTTGGSSRTPSSRLGHGGSLSWLRRGTMIRLGANDSRDLGGTKSYFQSLNLQGRQNERLQGSASLQGNLTINLSRQGYDAAPIPATDSLTSTASLSYTDLRVFNTRNMTFRSTLQAMSADLLKANDLNQNQQNQGQYSWENNLTYAIGKLKTELKGLVEEVHSSRRTTVIFHVSRFF